MRRAAGLFIAAALAFGAAYTARPTNAQSSTLTMNVIGNYRTGLFDEGAAEIVAYHAGSKALYMVNGASDAIDVLNVSDPTNPALIKSIALNGSPNSVAISGDVIAVAVEADPSQEPGSVVFLNLKGEVVNTVTVGALPDHVGFTPDGTKVLTANEGEPNDDYTVDPEGSVSIIDISGGVEKATVVTVGFADFNAGGPRAAELDKAVRIYGPKASVAQDLEPEYIAVSDDSKTAYVTLQENNALAVIDIAAGKVTAIVPLGFKDHSVEGNGLDTSDKDGKINIVTRPIRGMYQPDGIAAYTAGGMTYLVTANEGDTREYAGYSEETEIGDLKLDPAKFPDAAKLQDAAEAGRLNVTNALGDANGDGTFEEIYVYGARSFSIWGADGKLVWDSGDQIEKKIAELDAKNFNSENDENDSFDKRSDNKGPEPEGVAIGVVNGKTYAFVGLERQSAIIAYDITDPKAPVYAGYLSNRDWSGDPKADKAGDLGPEGLIFIPADASPNGQALLVVANEISGSVTIIGLK